jgi:hypothetical protein
MRVVVVNDGTKQHSVTGMNWQPSAIANNLNQHRKYNDAAGFDCRPRILAGMLQRSVAAKPPPTLNFVANAGPITK